MAQKHIILESSGEHHTFLVAIPLTSELVECIRKRAQLCQSVGKEDDALHSLSFGFYNFDVYEDVDMEELDLGDVDELPEEDLPEAERIDFGAMEVSERGFYLRFGIKHVGQIFETGPIDLKVFAEDAAA